jgi:hypothetical protein
MFYFLALIPATMLTIAGYFVLYLSNRSEGALRSLGKYLGFWAFTLAGLVVLGAIFAAAHHGARHGPMWDMRGMHGRMHGSGPEFFDGRPGEPPPGVPGPPAAPDSAAPPPR